jgi:predicted AlkP superfamily phosphohydrolase/phosphomutase
MPEPSKRKVSRRSFLKKSALTAAAGAATIGGGYWIASKAFASRSVGKKVIVIGIDGMDPGLCELLMTEGRLPNLKRLRDGGGFSSLGTSIPPQSPVAWANFINGDGPGSHGVFDFIHRHPEEQCDHTFLSFSETRDDRTILRREGTPFWDYLDEQGIPSTFYDLPCNYPASPSHHGHHRCLCGMGTPDMLGDYGKYQYFTTHWPDDPPVDIGGKRSQLVFQEDMAPGEIDGPQNTKIEFQVHRDPHANAAMIEIQGRRILLRAGQWSDWTRLTFLSRGLLYLFKNVNGICRFYLQEVAPDVKLYVSPINFDPSDPAAPISEPNSFVKEIAQDLGLFYTTGFQEDYNARKSDVFNDDEFLRQANEVLEERFALFDYAINNYEDGLLYFYFSSSDLQSHIFWWNTDDPHPLQIPDKEAQRRFNFVKDLYRKLDEKIGEVLFRYGNNATIIVMSDHGFANFRRQFDLNSWLWANNYLAADPGCQMVQDERMNWAQTRAYGLGINALYVNLKGRERNGSVEPAEKEVLLRDLVEALEDVRDADNDGAQVIRKVYRADEVYQGSATALAPDLIVGYSRGYRASWNTILGGMSDDYFLSNNPSPWSADHCADAAEVPGVLFCNRYLTRRGEGGPALIDVAPTILAEFGLPTPAVMKGRSFFPG